jgi:nucleotide-binding universal stress UspA family protein
MNEAAHEGAGFIVVGVDGSEESREALRWAAHQAKLTGASLKAVTAWEIPTMVGWAPVFPVDYDPESLAGRILDEAILAVLGSHPDVTVERVVTEGHPAPLLIAAAAGADLLVVGSRGHGEFAGMLIGSVSEHLVSRSPCAIVVVRSERPA